MKTLIKDKRIVKDWKEQLLLKVGDIKKFEAYFLDGYSFMFEQKKQAVKLHNVEIELGCPLVTVLNPYYECNGEENQVLLGSKDEKIEIGYNPKCVLPFSPLLGKVK